MKYLLNKFFVVMLVTIFSSGHTHAAKWGKGELKLDDYVLEKFIEYVKLNNSSKAPISFSNRSQNIFSRF